MLIPRVITAILLVLLMSGLLLLKSDQAWLFFMGVATLLAAWEWSGFCRLAKPVSRWGFALVITVLSVLSIQFASLQSLTSMTLMVMVVMVISVVQYQRSQGQIQIKSPALVLGLGALVLINFATAFMWFVGSFDPSWVLLSLMTIWAVDTGAYFSGRRFGKRKLAPYVSPGKSWEGVYGGAVFAFLVAWFGLNYLQPALLYSNEVVALLFTFVAIFSIFGDLFESLLKRQVGLKDSSQLLPGHGGILDRVDSLLIAVPMFYFIWKGIVV